MDEILQEVKETEVKKRERIGKISGKCLRCGIDFIGVKGKMYCSKLCQSRTQAYAYYKAHKDIKEYKDKVREYQRGWRKRNHEKWKLDMRFRVKDWQTRLKQERRDKGLCDYCGENPFLMGKRYCEPCHNQGKLRLRKRVK